MKRQPWLRRKKTAPELPLEAPIRLGNMSNGEFFHESTAYEQRIRTEILRHLSGMSGVASAGPEPDDVELTCPPLAPQVLAELEGLRRDEHAARDRRELAVADALRDAEGRPRLAATWLVREWQRSPRDAD